MRKYCRASFIVVFLVCCRSLIFAQDTTINDHIFPAAPSAKPFIDFDKKGFLVNGKRTFLVSAGLEYARLPQQLWYDRLLKLKRAGFNCVEIYTIWNYHEPKEGEFDFSGDHDLDAFLTLVKKLDMYAIVRVGPYYCAEWDNGGYPIWLKFKEGLRVREDNPVFEKYVDHFFDRLLPIVFRQQINKGGPVILVQLENEHPKGWGTLMPNPYFDHLKNKALQMGLQVPYFFSGLHHANDPAGNGNLDDTNRPNPWFSTEFWCVWYSQYGAKPNDAALYGRRTWKIIAHGGNGYNYYMAYGGSNFGYTNNDEDAASYDYGAAVGQAGDLRPIYYTFKRAAWFARSFEDILENSTDGSSAYQKVVSDTALKVTARTSPAGEIIFLDNTSLKPVKTVLQLNPAGKFISNPEVNVAAGEIFPIIHNFKLNPEIKLDWAFTRIYAIVNQGKTTTIVLDVEKNEPIALQFSTQTQAAAVKGNSALKITEKQIELAAKMTAATKPEEFIFTVGTQSVRVLAMNRKQTDKTWCVENTGENYIEGNASFTGEISTKNKRFIVETERPQTAKTTDSIWVYTENGSIVLRNENEKTGQQPAIINLEKWSVKEVSGFAARNYQPENWLQTKNPEPMGADGDVTADAWYRTKISVPTNGKYTLQAKGGGRALVYIDGKSIKNWKLSEGEISLDLKKGNRNLAVFTAHDGREKLAAYLGPIKTVDRKGVFGEAVIKKGGPYIKELNNWYFTKAVSVEDVKADPPKFDLSNAKKYKIGADAFQLKEGFGWFQTEISKLPAGISTITLSFKSVDENATVFINGKKMLRHEGWNIPFDVVFNDPNLSKKPIIISVFIENYSNEGGIDQPVKINTIGKATAINNWQLKGGPGNWQENRGWQTLEKVKKSVSPVFYCTNFNVSIIANETQIWRVHTTDLGHGSVWLNGHNLGRYPEKIAAPGLYIPECWLKNGLNELVIFEEEGKLPTQVKILAEKEAGRITEKFTGEIN